MTRNDKARIINITLERAPEAAEVLAEVFSEYPVLRYFFEDQGERYRQRVSALYHLSLGGVLAQRWHILGVEYGGKLAAAACLSSPSGLPEPSEIQEQEARFFREIGPQAASRIREFNKMQENSRYTDPHSYLLDIGVLEKYRGFGFARLLLEQIHLISAEDALSRGVGLDTQTQRNVELYRHFGYSVLSESKVGEIPYWAMFRPNSQPGTLTF